MMRPLEDDDLSLERDLDSDPEVLRYLYGRARTPDEVWESHLRRMELGATVEGLGYWILYAGPDFAGLMMLPPVDQPGAAELGYRLRRTHWGRGIATEASRELLRHGFETVGLERVFAQTMAVNRGSRGVMRAVGMRYVRTFHPVWEDPLPGAEEGEVEYEITAEEWARRTA
ncbi:GNAT family N-acetyltransferase [Actinoplanes missouriensis]